MGGKPRAAGAVELLVEVGFDVNAKGRADVAREDRWETALHVAAMNGNLHPLGWARNFDQKELVELLEAITAPETTADTTPEQKGSHRSRWI